MISLPLLLVQILALAVLLLVGYVLYMRVRLLRRLHIPAPVIAGFLGLLAGPEVLGAALALPQEGALGRWLASYARDWIPVYRLLPGVLITPVMAASVLGMKIPARREFVESVGRQLGYTIAFYWSQFALGIAVGALFLHAVYPTFGLELFAGFAGGHGTAGVYGQTLRDLDASYWEVGQGVALTTATVGLLFGVIGGIALINIAARRGRTVLLAPPQSGDSGRAAGLYRDPDTRPPVGRSVTAHDVLDPVSYTVALIALPSLLGILAKSALDALEIGVLQSVGEFAWALVAAAFLWVVVVRRGWSWILDTETKNRVAGTLVDFLVVAAVASLPVQAVLRHVGPIAALVLAGVTGSIVMYCLGRFLLPDHWVERSIITFGQCTGVAATGLLLLRIVDPEFKTPALSAWG
ncbi:MAG: hypothetical protein FJW35_09705, partial [Acidobacteria bacterium]|nr:hypothetical protein [Acidobacteriota bacterium]